MSLPIFQSQDPADQLVVAVARRLIYNLDEIPEEVQYKKIRKVREHINAVVKRLFTPEECTAAPTYAHILCSAIAELRDLRAQAERDDTQIERAKRQLLEGMEALSKPLAELHTERTRVRELEDLEKDVRSIVKWISGEAGGCITTTALGNSLGAHVAATKERFGKVGCCHCSWEAATPQHPLTPREEVLALLRAHVAVCPSHPMRKLEAELANLKAKAAPALPTPGMIVTRKAGGTTMFRVMRYAWGKVELVPTEGHYIASAYTLEEFFANFTPAPPQPKETQAPPQVGDVYVLRDGHEDDALYVVLNVLRSGDVLTRRIGSVHEAIHRFNKQFFRRALRPATPEEKKEGRRFIRR